MRSGRPVADWERWTVIAMRSRVPTSSRGAGPGGGRPRARRRPLRRSPTSGSAPGLTGSGEARRGERARRVAAQARGERGATQGAASAASIPTRSTTTRRRPRRGPCRRHCGVVPGVGVGPLPAGATRSISAQLADSSGASESPATAHATAIIGTPHASCRGSIPSASSTLSSSHRRARERFGRRARTRGRPGSIPAPPPPAAAPRAPRRRARRRRRAARPPATRAPSGDATSATVRTPGEASAPAMLRERFAWGRHAREGVEAANPSVPSIVMPPARITAAAGSAAALTAAASSGPQTKEELERHRLEREGGADALAAARHAWPQHLQGGRERGHESASDHGAGDQGDDGRPAERHRGEQSERQRIADRAHEEHPGLPEGVNRPALHGGEEADGEAGLAALTAPPSRRSPWRRAPRGGGRATARRRRSARQTRTGPAGARADAATAPGTAPDTGPRCQAGGIEASDRVEWKALGLPLGQRLHRLARHGLVEVVSPDRGRSPAPSGASSCADVLDALGDDLHVERLRRAR